MGIQGLSSFISNIDGLRNSHNLSDSLLVIDGNNLLYYLYRSSHNQKDFIFGGNYTEYRIHFKTFFENLKKCNISPIVVFDGGFNDQLKDNRMNRFKNYFSMSKQLSEDPPQIQEKITGDINFPFLLRKSLVSAIKEIQSDHKSSNSDKWQIFCFQTKLDSDLESAKLANDLKCPVVSNDGDFLIMNINGGVINCDSIQWEIPFKSNTSKHYIECKVYKVIDFLNHFGLKPEMLPIFGTIMGNDGMDGKVFYKLFGDIHREIGFNTVPENIRNYRGRQMWQLLTWLSRRFLTATQAIDYIENYLIEQNVDLKDFRLSIESFQTNGKSFLKQLFDHKMKGSDEKDIPIEDIVGEHRFPKWFLFRYFYRTELDSIFFTFVESRVFLMAPLIENFEFDSCFNSCLELYAILSGLLRLNVKERAPLHITLRKGYDYEKRDIAPKTHIDVLGEDDRKLPILSEIQSLSPNEKKDLLFNILKFNEKWMTDLEENVRPLKLDKQDIDFWKYFLVVIKYWKFITRVKHYFEFIRAIVYSLIYFRHNSWIENDFNSLTSISKDRLKPFVSHYFCEFQVIYSIINDLNAFLGYPITDSDLLNSLNGVLYYNLFNAIIDERLTLLPFKEHRLNKISKLIIDSVRND